MGKVLSKNEDKIVYSDGIIIRKYRAGDREAVRALCCDTAYFGESCEAFFPDRELLADLVMKYYTDYEPEYFWIAEYKGEIVGYICGYFNELIYNRAIAFKVVPISLIGALARGRMWDRKTSRMIVYIIKLLFSNEAKLKGSDCKRFSVHIHQNVKKGFRGKGIGNKLLLALSEQAERKKAPGIKFRALRQDSNFSFFEKHGFKKYDCKRVKTLEAWLKKVPLYFMEYGKSYYD